MPRRPAPWRRRRSLRFQPVTFSRFSRSVALVSSAYMSKRQVLDAKLRELLPTSSSGNGFRKQNVEEKIEQVESSEEEELEGVVQADFAFFDPKLDDFQGVKVLLQTYLDNEQWDLSGFVDLILGQTTVGTVVKVEDEEDEGLFSVVTALNLGRYKDHKCITEVKKFLLKVCLEKNIIANLKLLLGDQSQNVGLLVSQRVVNLPPQLLPPLYDALFDEVLWATEDEPTEELRKSFCFESFLLVSKIYKLKNADHRKRQNGHADEDIIYVKPEDEIFHKLCSWSFIFPCHTDQVTTHGLKNYQSMGLVMAVEANKMPAFREQLHSLIDES
uniref:Protein BCCIP homolog n=1 Tax=Rhizophora mucronata TaxID=61149 RepID=A0A2P2J9T6_RHIMU